MNMGKTLRTSLRMAGASVLAVAFMQTAQAVVITFDDIAPTGNAILTSATSSGFSFTSTHFHVIDTNRETRSAGSRG